MTSADRVELDCYGIDIDVPKENLGQYDDLTRLKIRALDLAEKLHDARLQVIDGDDDLTPAEQSWAADDLLRDWIETSRIIAGPDWRPWGMSKRDVEAFLASYEEGA